MAGVKSRVDYLESRLERDAWGTFHFFLKRFEN